MPSSGETSISARYGRKKNIDARDQFSSRNWAHETKRGNIFKEVSALGFIETTSKVNKN